MLYHDLNCDRHLAREARRIVKDVVTTLATSLRAEVASSCPLHASNDHLLPHEERKKALTQWQWRCAECGKLFKSEHYLDRHLDRKHASLLNSSHATTCLGEYCDILQCPTWLEALRRQERERPRPCKPNELEARRHLCQHLMHDCFAGGADLHPVFESMEERFCSPISCAGRQRLRAGSATASALPASLGGGGGSGGGGGTYYYVQCGLLLAGLTMLYVGLFCWYSETKVAPGELKARHGRRRNAGGGVWPWLQRTHRD